MTASPPVVVLGYSHGGTERLYSVLERHPDLACTVGTGILPLCDQAAVAWRNVDGRGDGPLSPLALSSTRALTASIIAAILARAGKRRWCETAFSSTAAATAFRELYPETRFLCLHRSCADVISDALHSNSWGLAGPSFAAYTAAYPHSSVAALTAYWTARTTDLMTFEESYPDAVRRVRYEDLAARSLDSELCEFLGVDRTVPALSRWSHDEGSAAEPAWLHHADPFPVGQLAPRLLDTANRLLRGLGYPPLGKRE